MQTTEDDAARARRTAGWLTVATTMSLAAVIALTWAVGAGWLAWVLWAWWAVLAAVAAWVLVRARRL